MYVLTYKFSARWVGDGIGNNPPPNAQVLSLTGEVVIPGGDAPSGGNLTTAGTNAGTDIGVQLNANIAQIQGFATGGP